MRQLLLRLQWHEATLGHIFAVGALSAPELATAAQVARLWRRVAAVDALWRAAWRCAAPSLREQEGSFRAALTQLHAARTLAGGVAAPPLRWRLTDFTFIVDVSWHGAPLFAATTPANELDLQCYCDAGTTLCFRNTLPRNADAGDAPAALCAQQLLQPEQPHAQAAAVAALRMRLLVRRADGALACLLDGATCLGTHTSDLAADDATATERTTSLTEAFWNSRALTETRGDLRARVPYVDDETQLHRINLELDVTVHDDRRTWVEEGAPQPGPLFRHAMLLLSCYDEREARSEPVWNQGVLRALARGNLRWVARTGADAAAPSGSGLSIDNARS
jgi:hypothetical protein